MTTNPLDPSLRLLNDCGCGNGTTVQTPATIANRPGLAAISFRSGTHAQFKASLLAGLTSAERKTLAGLRTREDDDPAIALLDGFAAMADVLTFYSERIANEGLLRTATERRSVLELARSIGYELKPGVAASTWLAFTVEDAPGAPRATNIPTGTKIQSIPGPDEKPQIYETTEPLGDARTEWNALTPFSSRVIIPGMNDRDVRLQGTNTGLKPGDALLFVGDERKKDADSERWDLRLVQTVTPDSAGNFTRVTWHEGLGWRRPKHIVRPASDAFKVFALRQRASIFGHNAPNWKTLPQSVKNDYVGSTTDVHLGEWPDFLIFPPDKSKNKRQNPPGFRVIPPTPEQVAQAANQAAAAAAETAQRDVSSAVTTALHSTADTVLAFVQTADLARDMVQKAAIKAGGDSLAAYSPMGANSALAELLQTLQEIGSLISITVPTLKYADGTPPDVASLANYFKEAVAEAFKINIDWTDPYLDGGELPHFDGPDFKPGTWPHIVWTQPSISSGNAGDNIKEIAGFLERFLADLNNPGVSLKIAPGFEDRLVSLGNNLARLITAHPALLPFTTLKNFIDANQSGGDDTVFGKLKVCLSNVEASLENARQVIGSVAAVGETKVIVKLLSQTVEMALHPPVGLPPPTPESVGAVARFTTKVAKFAALLTTPQNILPQASNAAPTSSFQQILHAAQPASLRAAGSSVSIDAIYHQIGANRFAAIDLPPDFRNLDDEDRAALAVVLGTGAVAAGGAVAVGGAVAGVAAVAALTSGTAGFLLSAPLLAAMPALGLTGAALVTGPELVKNARRTETEVTNAVHLALQAKQEAIIKSPDTPERDCNTIDLDSVYAGIFKDSWLALANAGAVELFRVSRVVEAARAEYMLSGKTSRVTLEGEHLAWSLPDLPKTWEELASRGMPAAAIALLQSLHGEKFSSEDLLHAKLRETLAPTLWETYQKVIDDVIEKSWFASDVRGTAVFAQSEELKLTATPFAEPLMGSTIALSTVLDPLPPDGRRLIVIGRPSRVQLQEGAGALTLIDDEGGIHSTNIGDVLTVIAAPSARPLEGTSAIWQLRNASGLTGRVTAEIKHFKFLPADPASNPVTDFVLLKRASNDDGQHTVLTGATPLLHAYDPGTVTIHGNVAFATHGESVTETVGSGNATQPNPHFSLKQAPLTYVPAANAAGSVTTLGVFVNDVKWTEVETLYEHGARERIYVSRQQADGSTQITSGDGWLGALLPTGQENIRAVYRKGTGLEGLVRTGQLSLLLTRPLGVKAVTNPAASTGAEDPEKIEDARRNAPLQTLTLGRVVSLQDYEDFSRTFSGIAKAHAVWGWTPRGRGVFVTVVAPGGKDLPEESETLKNLRAALMSLGNPLVPLKVEPGVITPFELAGEIICAADRIPERVKAAVDGALLPAYGFDARNLGQNLALSEVIALIQKVPGVESVNLTRLRYAKRAGPHDPLNPLLPAVRPKAGTAFTTALPAEVLVLSAAALSELTVRKP